MVRCNGFVVMFATQLMTSASLQLSTSINMPFSPFRPQRFPDSMNRSRYQVTNPVPRVRQGRSNTMPTNVWHPPYPQQTRFQPVSAQAAMPMTQTRQGVSHRKVHSTVLQRTTPSLDTSCHPSSIDLNNSIIADSWMPGRAHHRTFDKG
jgi:hypothetical protein